VLGNRTAGSLTQLRLRLKISLQSEKKLRLVKTSE